MKQVKKIVIKNEPYQYEISKPLLSIHLASNRPDQFTEFARNMYDSCANKNAYEIVVKIDTEDTVMRACVDDLIKQYGAKPMVKVLIAALDAA